MLVNGTNCICICSIDLNEALASTIIFKKSRISSLHSLYVMDVLDYFYTKTQLLTIKVFKL